MGLYSAVIPLTALMVCTQHFPPDICVSTNMPPSSVIPFPKECLEHSSVCLEESGCRTAVLLCRLVVVPGEAGRLRALPAAALRSPAPPGQEEPLRKLQRKNHGLRPGNFFSLSSCVEMMFWLSLLWPGEPSDFLLAKRLRHVHSVQPEKSPSHKTSFVICDTERQEQKTILCMSRSPLTPLWTYDRLQFSEKHPDPLKTIIEEREGKIIPADEPSSKLSR